MICIPICDDWSSDDTDSDNWSSDYTDSDDWSSDDTDSDDLYPDMISLWFACSLFLSACSVPFSFASPCFLSFVFVSTTSMWQFIVF